MKLNILCVKKNGQIKTMIVTNMKLIPNWRNRLKMIFSTFQNYS